MQEEDPSTLAEALLTVEEINDGTSDGEHHRIRAIVLLVHVEDLNSDAGLRCDVANLQREFKQFVQFAVVFDARVKLRFLSLLVHDQADFNADVEVVLVEISKSQRCLHLTVYDGRRKVVGSALCFFGALDHRQHGQSVVLVEVELLGEAGIVFR